MAKDKDKGKETKPSLEIEVAAKIQDDAVKAKEIEAKDVHAFQPSKEGDHVRFFVRQSLGLTWIAEHPVVKRKRALQAISPLLLSHRRYHPCLLDYC